MKTVSLLLCLFVLSLNAAAQQQPLAITHVTVIDMTGSAPLRDMTVVVTGDRISAIGKSSKLQVPTQAQVIDGKGKFLIPGLWDMHVHFTEVERTFPMFIANGVTGVRNMGGDLEQLVHWRSEVSSGTLLGPRVVTCGPIVDGPDPAAHGPVVVVASAAEGRAIIKKLVSGGADCIKVYDRLPRDAYFAIIDEARKKNVPVVGHVPLSIAPEAASAAGQQSIEHLGNIFESASSLGEKLFEEESKLGPVKDPSEFPRRIAARGERFSLNLLWPDLWIGSYQMFDTSQRIKVPCVEVGAKRDLRKTLPRSGQSV